MKKLSAVLLSFTFIFLCACNSAQTEETTVKAEETTLPEEITTVESLSLEKVDPAKVLTVYFSHKDSVSAAAEYISEKTDGGLYRIETTGKYPEDEAELVKKAHEEHLKNIRPALKNAPGSMSEYDIIFLCFPSWDNTMPMAVWTFIEDYDMRDKAVIPVCEGSSAALTNAIRDINNLVPGMMVVEGFSYTEDFLSIADDFGARIDTALYG